MIRELDPDILLKGYPDHGLMKGDMGAMTQTADDVRPTSARDIPNVRIA